MDQYGMPESRDPPGLISAEPIPVAVSDKRFCYGCGKPVHPSATACPNCGARFDSPVAVRSSATSLRGREVFCRACGRPINAAAPLCPGCGAPQQGVGIVEGTKSRIAAALLAIFLGGIGIHKFYLGQPFLGILYIVFCWTFIPAIIAFIEGIVYLCMSDMAFARKYG
jgi:TM2 domain-containing membrane protein YozV